MLKTLVIKEEAFRLWYVTTVPLQNKPAALYTAIAQRGDSAGLLWLEFASCERVPTRTSLPVRARATGHISSASIPLSAEPWRKRAAQRCHRPPTRGVAG